MASISPMNMTALRAQHRRKSLSTSNLAAIATLAHQEVIGKSLESKVDQFESARPTPYPGFGAQPPMVVRPLMMIDPAAYHHLRRWPIRVGPVRIG